MSTRCECEEGLDIQELCLNCRCQTVGCTSKRPVQGEFELELVDTASAAADSVADAVVGYGMVDEG